MFLLLDFSSSSLLYYFLALLLSVLLSGDGWMQKLSTTFQSFPAVWKQITLSSSDISTTQVVSGKRLKNHFTSISYPKDWTLRTLSQATGFSLLSCLWDFFPWNNFFPPSISSAFFHLSSSAKQTYSFLHSCVSYSFPEGIQKLWCFCLTQLHVLFLGETSQITQDSFFQPPPQKPDQNQ